MSPNDGSGPQRFAAMLRRRQISGDIRQLPASTRTAVEAAGAIGCEVAEIAKSIVFRNETNDTAIIVVASGCNHVDRAKVSRLVGAAVRLADADFVRQQTGYAIGGVPPFGFASKLPTLIDDDLFALGAIWAAAGGPFAVFETTAAALLSASAGRRADIKVSE